MRKIKILLIASGVLIIVGISYMGLMNLPKATWCPQPGYFMSLWRSPLPIEAQWMARRSAEVAVEDGCYDRN